LVAGEVFIRGYEMRGIFEVQLLATGVEIGRLSGKPLNQRYLSCRRELAMTQLQQYRTRCGL
jgi:hypothetical protein